MPLYRMPNSLKLSLSLPLLLTAAASGADTAADAPPATPPRAVSSAPALQPAAKENFIVYKEPGRYGGWPANHGFWQWGDELVVGFTSTWFKGDEKGHQIDRKKPRYEWQARSQDGGKTWEFESDLPFVNRKAEAKPTPLVSPLDFTAPDFALMFRFGGLHAGPSWFYVSPDRCKTWQGPYSFAVPGVEGICTRTDLIVLGARDCLMFGSCGKKIDGREGRVFCARTTDGGLNWKLMSYIGEEPPAKSFAIMPSSVRLPDKDGTILTTIRRSDGSIDAWRSHDLGATWSFASKAATGIGGNPPALVLLPDGRAALTYGVRVKPFGARARLSQDGGLTWGPEIILRDDGFDGDLGYPRSLVRPDGRVMTIYYFNGPRLEDRTIEGTLWKP